jgi:hypothetical protein
MNITAEQVSPLFDFLLCDEIISCEALCESGVLDKIVLASLRLKVGALWLV